jgi:Flp pilus assembly protein TadD
MRAAETRVEEALSLAPNEPRAHMALGLIYTFTRRVERASLNASMRWPSTGTSRMHVAE